MKDKHLYRIYVRGRVQGVGYRWSALREANRRGIKGFVRNQDDGSVYIEAEGHYEKLLDFIEWCRSGPGYVSSVRVVPAPPENYDQFTIRHY